MLDIVKKITDTVEALGTKYIDALIYMKYFSVLQDLMICFMVVVVASIAAFTFYWCTRDD